MYKKQKMFAFLLAFLMLFTLLPIRVMAAEQPVDSVEFYVNDSLYKSCSILEVEFPKEPSEEKLGEGIEFVGWSYKGDLAELSSKTTKDGKYRIDAVTQKKNYNIVFKDYNGVEIEKLKIEHGNKFNKIPELENLKSWKCNDKNYTNAQLQTLEVKSDMVITAVQNKGSKLANFSVEFYGLDANEVQYKETGFAYNQTVNQGECAYNPGLPTQKPDNKTSFKDWYKTENEMPGEVPFDFSSPITEDTKIYARYRDDWHVSFLDVPVAGQADLVIATQNVRSGQKANESNAPTSANIPNGFKQRGWKFKGTDNLFSFDAPITKDIELVPNMVKAYHVYFLSYGSPVVSQYVAEDELIAKPENPTREGYNFDKWVTERAGTADFDFSKSPTENLTIYAKWTPKEVEYKVAYYFEKQDLPKGANLDDPANFDFIEEQSKRGNSGEVIQVTGATASPNSNMVKQYGNFYKSPDTMVLGTQNAVVNVYYTRKEYTLRFNLNQYTNYNATMNWKNTVYTNDGAKYEFKAKYGNYIGDDWPLNSINGDNHSIIQTNNSYTYYFRGWQGYSSYGTADTIQVSKRLYLVADMITHEENGVINQKADWMSAGRNTTLNYMFEALPSEINNPNIEKLEFKGKKYVKSATYSQQANLSYNTNLMLKDIEGMIPSTGVTDYSGRHYALAPDGNGGYVHNSEYGEQFLFYNRQRHNLTYNVMNRANYSNKTYELMYGETLQDYGDNISSDSAFQGWYLNTEKMNDAAFDPANKTMPKHNLALFAKWAAGQHTISFYLDQNDYNNAIAFGQKQKVDDGELVNLPAYPALYDKHPTEDKVFMGWSFMLNDKAEPFAFEMTIYQDLDLVATWKSEGFKVTYNKGENNIDSVEAPKDDNLYDYNARIRAKEGDYLNFGNDPETKYFCFWQDGSGNVYYPGGSIPVKRDLNLTAKYYKKADSKNLIYNSNNIDNPETKIDRVPINKSMKLRGEDTFSREGYLLTGWSNMADSNAAGAKKHGLEAEYSTQNTSANETLYAIWVKSYDVKFEVQSGTDGKLQPKGTTVLQDSVSVNKVAENTAISQIVPTPIDGENFYFTGWTPQLPSQVSQAATYTANFIEKKDPSTQVQITPFEGTYDDQDHTIKVENANGFKLEYSENENGPWSDQPITKKDATENTNIFVKLSGNRQFKDKVMQSYIKINKRQLTITTASKANVEYNGQSHVLEGYTNDQAEYGGTNLTNETGLLKNQKLQNISASAPVGPNIGIYSCKVNLPQDLNSTVVDENQSSGAGKLLGNNYNIVIIEGNLHIVPYTGVVNIAPSENMKTYGEVDPKLSANVNGAFGEVDYELVRQNGEDVNTYKINVNLGSNPNYANITSSESEFVINERPITLQANSYNKTVGANDPNFGTRVVTGNIVGNDNLNYTVNRTTGEAIGEYPITITLGNNPNYDISTLNGVLNIEAAAIIPRTTGTTPAQRAFAATVDPAAGTPIQTAIESALGNPVEESVIDDNTTPLGTKTPSWALLNLILAIGTSLMSILMLVLYFNGRNKEKELADGSLEKNKTKRKGLLRLISLIPAISSIVMFILTQNMSLPMIMVDNWTIWMAVIAGIQIALAIFSSKDKNKDTRNLKESTNN